MALGTVQAGMSTGQWESGAGMVEGGRFPGAGGMAGAAVPAKLAAVIILRCMAGIAIGGCTLEYVVGMTTHAWGIGVCAGQFE
jgi:hypothetical protein